MAVCLSSSSSASCSCNPRAALSRYTPKNLGCHGALQGLGTSNLGKLSTLRRVAAVAANSLLLSSLRGTPLRSGDKHKAGSVALSERQSGPLGSDVRASSIGVVKEVALVSKEPLFYNVTLTVSPTSEVATWYTTPGQYVNLIPVESQYSKGNTSFFASPVRKLPHSVLEFLVEDVPNTVANELINSKPGDRVVVTTSSSSTGFNLSTLNSIEESQSVLMFASGYGLSPLRALIETGFEASKRKHAILYALYTADQTPYVNRFPAWEQTGVKVLQGPLDKGIIETDLANTVVLMVASKDQQEELATYFGKKGVSEDRILTLFSGISTSDKSYYNKVLQQLSFYPNFPHHAENHVSVELTV